MGPTQNSRQCREFFIALMDFEALIHAPEVGGAETPMKMPIAEDAEVAEARGEKQSRPLLYFVALAKWVASNAFRARATLARMRGTPWRQRGRIRFSGIGARGVKPLVFTGAGSAFETDRPRLALVSSLDHRL